MADVSTWANRQTKTGWFRSVTLSNHHLCPHVLLELFCSHAVDWRQPAPGKAPSEVPQGRRGHGPNMGKRICRFNSFNSWSWGGQIPGSTIPGEQTQTHLLLGTMSLLFSTERHQDLPPASTTNLANPPPRKHIQLPENPPKGYGMGRATQLAPNHLLKAFRNLTPTSLPPHLHSRRERTRIYHHSPSGAGAWPSLAPAPYLLLFFFFSKENGLPWSWVSMETWVFQTLNGKRWHGEACARILIQPHRL